MRSATWRLRTGSRRPVLKSLDGRLLRAFLPLRKAGSRTNPKVSLPFNRRELLLAPRREGFALRLCSKQFPMIVAVRANVVSDPVVPITQQHGLQHPVYRPEGGDSHLRPETRRTLRPVSCSNRIVHMSLEVDGSGLYSKNRPAGLGISSSESLGHVTATWCRGDR